jgi:hypothetical protein
MGLIVKVLTSLALWIMTIARSPLVKALLCTSSDLLDKLIEEYGEETISFVSVTVIDAMKMKNATGAEKMEYVVNKVKARYTGLGGTAIRWIVETLLTRSEMFGIALPKD